MSVPKIITGVAGDQVQPPCFLQKVRVAGVANLVAAVQVKLGATVLDTIPIGATPGTEREYASMHFDPLAVGALIINMGNAGDTVELIFG